MARNGISNNKAIVASGRRRGKRVLMTQEVLRNTGQNPIENIIRLARKAEKDGDYSNALRGWIEIQSYIEAKRKAVDPMEQDAKRKQAMTIKELEAIRDQLLAGTTTAIIEVEAIEIAEIVPAETRHPLT